MGVLMHKEALPILYLHGLYGYHAQWRPLGNALQQALPHLCLQNIFYPLPCHRDGRPIPLFSPEEIAKVAINYLDERDIQQVGIIGHSLGGRVAYDLATTSPARVAWLIALDALPAAYPLNDGLAKHHKAIHNALLATLPFEGAPRETIKNLLATALPDAKLCNYLIGNYRKANGTYSWAIDLNTISNYIQKLHAAQPAPSPIPQPTLLIRSDESGYCPLDETDRLQSTMPNMQVVTITGCNHFLHQNASGPVTEAIAHFIAKLYPRPKQKTIPR